MCKKNILKAVLLVAGMSQVSAQDRHFSQYAEMSSVINPALTGAIHNTRVTGGYRTQWGSVVGGKAYQTYGVVFEQTIKHKKLKDNYFAVCGNIFRDIAGDSKMSNLTPNVGVAYVQKINRQMKITGGLQGGFIYKTIDVTGLTWDRQFNGYEYDPNRPSGETNVPRSAITAYDVGGGVNFSYAQSSKYISSLDGNKLNVGVAAYHYSIPSNSFFNSSEKLATRIVAYASGEILIPKTKNAVMPSILFMNQGPYSEFIVGSLFKFILADQSIRTTLKKPSSFAIGAQYRYKDAIIPTVLWQYDKYAIGVSYDINVSSLTPASRRNGGLEVMLRYNVSPGYGKNLGRGDTKASY